LSLSEHLKSWIIYKNMFNKKLKNRLASLEEYLGVRYSRENDNLYADEHIETDFSLIKTINKRIDNLEGKKK